MHLNQQLYVHSSDNKQPLINENDDTLTKGRLFTHHDTDYSFMLGVISMKSESPRQRQIACI